MEIALSATPDFSPDRDCPKVLRQTLAPPAPSEAAAGAALPMPSLANQARWPEAIALTVSLWLFVLLLFLPIIIARYEGANWTSVALDCSTVPVSIMLALSMFAVFRRTVDQPLRQRVIVMVVTVIVTATINTAFDLTFQTMIASRLDHLFAQLPSDISRAYPSLLNYILVFGVNMALFQVGFARRAALKQELALSQALANAQHAQLAALRYQLNPHFLFNALNSISALIVTQRNEDAERMTDKLSSFLRSSLNADPGELIPLEEELALTEEYLDIESVRFGERLDVEVDCSPHACEALIPSFLVQPLVENAIKHGVARTRGSTKITITGDVQDCTLRITVANCLPTEQTGPSHASSGVGLINVGRRLEAVYGKAGKLEAGIKDDRYQATITIPVCRSPQEA
ncbi:MAG: sensor histidine kinase [Allosphingosinicella sp.]|uniref:sensor histidine kinase n=1 Tax=Allosphingosinicella sp. TaxID=2823234 RepID=UPI003950F98A